MVQVGDLQPWMDESFLYNIFVGTNQARWQAVMNMTCVRIRLSWVPWPFLFQLQVVWRFLSEGSAHLSAKTLYAALQLVSVKLIRNRATGQSEGALRAFRLARCWVAWPGVYRFASHGRRCR